MKKEEEEEEDDDERGRMRKVGSSILMTVCEFICIPYSVHSDIHICETNDVQHGINNYIAVTFSLILLARESDYHYHQTDLEI